VGVLSFVIGTIVGQFCGAAAYRRIARNPGPRNKLAASIVAGLVTTLCASSVFVVLGVHQWLGGPETSWGASVFLGICIGICQAVLFKHRPLPPLPAA
jgi:ABC-type Co2+ transport system permease subunit